MSRKVNVSSNLFPATETYLSRRKGRRRDRYAAEAQGLGTETCLGAGGGCDAGKSSNGEEVEAHCVKDLDIISG